MRIVNRQIPTTSGLVLIITIISSNPPPLFPITRVSGIVKRLNPFPITGRRVPWGRLRGIVGRA